MSFSEIFAFGMALYEIISSSTLSFTRNDTPKTQKSCIEQFSTSAMMTRFSTFVGLTILSIDRIVFTDNPLLEERVLKL